MSIREEIMFGYLPPDQSVGETALAEQFNVSRTPVREALLRLERDGFVNSVPGRGFVVAGLSAEQAQQLYPIVWSLEGLAVRSSVPWPAIVDELRSINEQLASASSIHDRVRLDSEWHRTLISASANVPLEDIVDGVRSSVYRYEYAYMASHPPRDTSCQQHDEVVDLFERNPAEAAKALEMHWREGLSRLLAMLED